MPSHGRIQIRQPSGDAPAVELAYEAHGDPSNPAILLVMGLGATLANWPPRTLREPLAEAGFYVVGQRPAMRSGFGLITSSFIYKPPLRPRDARPALCVRLGAGTGGVR